MTSEESPHKLRLHEGRVTTTRRDGRRVVVVSDLHLGLRPPFGFPPDLTVPLAGLLRASAERGDVLVLAGDVLDRGPTRLGAAEILARHPRLRDVLAAACARTEVHFLHGNHEPPLEDVARALPWRVSQALRVDDDVLLLHGHELDAGLETTALGRAGEAWGLLQRLVGQRIDAPVADHDHLPGRLAATLVTQAARLLDERGDPDVRAWLDANVPYLASLEAEIDPRFVVSTLSRTALPEGIRTVVCGHTHRPGLARVGEITYVNAGTWSPICATFALLDGRGARVIDAVTGREHGFEAYERWREPFDWRIWARDENRAATAAPLAERVGERLLGGLGRWDVQRVAAHIGNVASLVARPGAASATDDAPGPEPEQDATQGRLRFAEVLTGTLDVGERAEDLRQTRLELSGAWERDARSAGARLAGTLSIAGVADRRPTRGWLRLEPGGRLRYRVTFTDDAGRELELEALKLLRLPDLGRALTEAACVLRGLDGRVVGEGDVAIDTRRDLGAFVRSLAVDLPRTRSSASSDRGFSPLPDAFPGPASRRLRAIVTGAAGHLGYNLVGQLLARGHDVVALVRDPGDAARCAPLMRLGEQPDGALEIRGADVASPLSLRLALQGGADVLLHTAGVVSFAARDAEREVLQPNVRGTANAVRAAADAGIGAVIATSSIAALGTDARGRDPLDERDWNRDARSPYYRSKTEGERAAWEIAGAAGLRLATILPGTFLGPNFFRHTSATRIVGELVAGRMPAVPPLSFPWIDVRDVAWAHVLAAEDMAASGRYPVAAHHLSVEEMLRALHEVDPDLPIPRRRLPAAAMPLLPALDWLQARVLGTPRLLDAATLPDVLGKELRVSSARIARELGFRPTALQRTLEDTVAWTRERFS